MNKNNQKHAIFIKHTRTMLPFIIAKNLALDARISIISHLGGDKQCRQFRTQLYKQPDALPTSTHTFAKSFDDFTKEFIHTRFGHCPNDLLTDAANPTKNIVKLLNLTIITKAAPLETLAHFANIINDHEFVYDYMELNDHLTVEDIAINQLFLQEFCRHFYNYGETWIWNYTRKIISIVFVTSIYIIIDAIYYILIALNFIINCIIQAFCNGGILYVNLMELLELLFKRSN